MLLEERIKLSPSDLISVEELRKRWRYAAREEVKELWRVGKLIIYRLIKAIDDVLFCVPVKEWSEDLWEPGIFNFNKSIFYYIGYVKLCEEKYPDFTGGNAPFLMKSTNQIFIEELENRLAGKDARIAELEAQLAAATEGATNKEEAQAVTEADTLVKAAKWENSVSAAFDLWNEIFQGNKNSWTRDEFTTALAKKYPDYHTKVLTLAWSRLPEKYKQGPGRPKTCENPKNP